MSVSKVYLVTVLFSTRQLRGMRVALDEMLRRARLAIRTVMGENGESPVVGGDRKMINSWQVQLFVEPGRLFSLGSGFACGRSTHL